MFRVSFLGFHSLAFCKSNSHSSHQTSGAHQTRQTSCHRFLPSGCYRLVAERLLFLLATLKSARTRSFPPVRSGHPASQPPPCLLRRPILSTFHPPVLHECFNPSFFCPPNHSPQARSRHLPSADINWRLRMDIGLTHSMPCVRLYLTF